MDADTIFQMSGGLVALGWLALIITPFRWPWLIWGVGAGIPAILGAVYGGLMLTHFASVEGGGYGSLTQVRALMDNEWVLLAGWIHYLAFDLAIGAYIAHKSDAAGISRLIQIPMLILTFQFGPVGYLLFILVERGWLWTSAGHVQAPVLAREIV